MGIVNNGTYFDFFEVGRSELMRSFGMPYTLFEDAGVFLPLIEAHAEYIAPARYDDLLDIEATLREENMGARIKFEYNIFHGNTTIAKGYTVHSYLNAVTMRAQRPPRFFTEWLDNYKKMMG
jgi:acyl-CoA thioester hydrolase